VNGVNYAAAVFPDGKIAGDPSLGPGFRRAVPGDVVQLYATGLAPAPAGTAVTVTPLAGVSVTVGTAVISPSFAGLVAPGEFQINFTVPQSFSSMPAGNYPVSVTIGGISSPTTLNSAPPGPVVIPIQP
jgi:uncharacterized protein (TIGR03437 family)